MTNLEQFISEAAEKLKTENHPRAGDLPIPSKLDQEVSQLVETIIRATPEERTLISSKFGPDHTFVLLGFSERMAALAVREGSHDILFKGLVALAFEDAKFDVRENILVLAPLYHSAVKIGTEPTELFHRVATYATDEELRAAILNFPDRLEANRGLAAMGYIENMGPDGFLYKRIW